MKYEGLHRIGSPVVVHFITKTEEAARRLAELRCPYLMAASLDAVRSGPHGEASTVDGANTGASGCWWTWDANNGGLIANAPIDYWSKAYAEDYPNGVWRMPLDNPFSSDWIKPSQDRRG